MEQVAADGLSKIQEMGAVFTLLVIIIAGLVWEHRRLSMRVEKITSEFMDSLKTHSDNFASVVEKNTSAFTELRQMIRECTKP